jgi:hypothetical protein
MWGTRCQVCMIPHWRFLPESFCEKEYMLYIMYILKFNSIPHDQVLSEWFLVAFPWHIVSLTVQVIALTLKHLVRPFCKPSVKTSSYQMSKHVALNKGELWNHTAIKLSGDTRSSSYAMNDIFWIILWAISHSQQSHINTSFRVIISYISIYSCPKLSGEIF